MEGKTVANTFSTFLFFITHAASLEIWKWSFWTDVGTKLDVIKSCFFFLLLLLCISLCLCLCSCADTLQMRSADENGFFQHCLTLTPLPVMKEWTKHCTCCVGWMLAVAWCIKVMLPICLLQQVKSLQLICRLLFSSTSLLVAWAWKNWPRNDLFQQRSYNIFMIASLNTSLNGHIMDFHGLSYPIFVS